MEEEEEGFFPVFEFGDREWLSKAACAGKSHLFEPLDTERGDNPKQVKELNLANFKEAGKICASCPVSQECEDSATPDDLAYTYRAGMVPSSFSMNLPGRPSTQQGDVCKNGHRGDWYVHKDGYRRCRACKRMGYVKPTTKSREPRDGTCSRGHMDWRHRPDGRRACRECERLRDEKSVANFDPARYAQKTCKRGHVGEYAPRGGRIECMGCRRHISRKRYAINGGKIAR